MPRLSLQFEPFIEARSAPKNSSIALAPWSVGSPRGNDEHLAELPEFDVLP